MSGCPAVELAEVTKDFVIGLRGVRLRAVDRLTLRVKQGQVFGLLGPNGCGKSTTIKMILGFLAPTQGQCEVFGLPSHVTAARTRIGYLPEAPDFYRFLTGEELVRFAGGLCGLNGKRLTESVGDALASVGMSVAAGRRVGTYSKGMLQRIGLAQAIVHRPELLILDEPTAGVDASSAAQIAELILRFRAERKTVLITSHHLHHIEEVCDHVAVLDHGRLQIAGSTSDLLLRSKTQRLSIDPLSDSNRADLDRWLIGRGLSPSRTDAAPISLESLYRDHTATSSPLRIIPAETCASER
jgi:ABC-2 type transport system ATP-binding protein